MTSLTRKFATSARGGARLLAIAALLLPAALLTQAEMATAEPPEITIYHSLDPLGADPRSEAVPPGCSVGTGGGGDSIIVVGDVDAGNNPTFYGNVLGAGTRVLAGRGTMFGVSNIIAHYETLPGVTVTVTNTTITSEILANYDLLIFNQITTWNKALSYTAAELTAIGDFIDNGGTLLLVAEFDNAPDYPSANAFLAGIGSSLQYTGQRALYTGSQHAVVADAPYTDGLVSFNAAWYNTLTGGESIVAITTAPPDPFAGATIVATDSDGTIGPPTVDCVISGGSDEELRLWIYGGPTPSGDGESICSQDVAGDPGVEGGNGDEICGAAMTFQIQGTGRFQGAIEAPAEVDDGIDTIMLGTECTPLGDGPECAFPETPPLKQLSLSFRRGGSDPSHLRRFMGSLIIDSRGASDVTEINVIVQGARAKGQLVPYGDPEIVAVSVPEPGQFAQLLSGLLGLAALNRLRRKH